MVQTLLGATDFILSIPIPNDTRNHLSSPLPGLKRPQLCAKHLLPSRDEVTIEQDYPSISPTCRYEALRGNLYPFYISVHSDNMPHIQSPRDADVRSELKTSSDVWM